MVHISTISKLSCHKPRPFFAQQNGIEVPCFNFYSLPKLTSFVTQYQIMDQRLDLNSHVSVALSYLYHLLNTWKAWIFCKFSHSYCMLRLLFIWCQSTMFRILLNSSHFSLWFGMWCLVMTLKHMFRVTYAWSCCTKMTHGNCFSLRFENSEFEWVCFHWILLMRERYLSRE